jgi:hypothetical protein
MHSMADVLQPLLPWTPALMAPPTSSPTPPIDGDSLRVTEEYSARNAAHPKGRVSLEDIEAEIACVHYVNAGDAVEDSGMDPTSSERRLTLAFLSLANGFCVVGKSAPMDPANFDTAKGQRFAYEDGVRQIWPLMAYSRLDHAPRDARDDDPVHVALDDEDDEDDEDEDLREPETGD